LLLFYLQNPTWILSNQEYLVTATESLMDYFSSSSDWTMQKVTEKAANSIITEVTEFELVFHFLG
jgi:hypothetical protein